jgi:hypothetical protein
MTSLTRSDQSYGPSIALRVVLLHTHLGFG